MHDCIVHCKTNRTLKYATCKYKHQEHQPWASECPDVKNYKWRLNPVWRRLLYSKQYPYGNSGRRKVEHDNEQSTSQLNNELYRSNGVVAVVADVGKTCCKTTPHSEAAGVLFEPHSQSRRFYLSVWFGVGWNLQPHAITFSNVYKQRGLGSIEE